MTHPAADPRQEIDSELEGWFAATAPSRARADLLDDVLSQTGGVHQESRGRLSRLLRYDLAPTRSRPLTIVLAVLLVLAIGVAAIATGSVPLPSIVRLPQDPESTWINFARLPDASVFGTHIVGDATGTPFGYVAVGGSVDGANTVSTAWWSPDGLAWVESAPDPVFTDTLLSRVATGASAIVAIGQSCACRGGTIAVSTDGRRWHGIDTGSGGNSPGGPGAGYESIAATANGFVAVGPAGDPAGHAFDSTSVATSPDAIRWTPLSPNQPEFTGHTMNAVAAGPGGLIAIGTDSALAPVEWSSVDGKTWTLVPDGGRLQGRLRDLAGSPKQFVAVGSEGANAVVWSSPDGRTWTVAPASSSLSNASMSRVIWTGSRFLALGSSDAGNGLAWLSADGLTWTRLDTGGLFERASITAAVVVGSRLELFGSDAGGGLIVAISAP